MKKYIKLILVLITFGAVIYGIYQKPELILTEETQTKLIELSEKIDNQLDETFSEDKIIEIKEEKVESVTDIVENTVSE